MIAEIRVPVKGEALSMGVPWEGTLVADMGRDVSMYAGFIVLPVEISRLFAAIYYPEGYSWIKPKEMVKRQALSADKDSNDAE